MRVLLVTLHDNLEMALIAVLNPANEYCAIVTDEVEPAKKILEKLGLPQNLVYPLYELKECIENLYYDCCFLLSDLRTVEGNLPKNIENYILSKSKFVHFCIVNNFRNHLLLKRAIKYYEVYAQQFEMFATGMCFTQNLDVHMFKYELFNFGRGSQDLYRDYQIAKRVLTPNRGGGRLKYALIGLAPYSFHYDQSKTYSPQIFQYYFALNDLHNFKMSAEEFGTLFRKEFLALELSLENFDVNNVYLTRAPNQAMNINTRINDRGLIDVWNKKIYNETCEENIKILDDYLSLCEENKVRPIIFTTPFTEGYVKYFSKEKLHELYYLIQTALKKHSDTVFFDGWSLSHLFKDSDFRDAEHLTIEGSAKFSAMFNSVIEGLEK